MATPWTQPAANVWTRSSRSSLPGPASYTTEDVVELQGHAGPAVGQRMLGAALAQGCRLARPGEFTSRAFLGGRVDLSQAEAVARLVDALSQGEARLALSALEGGLAKALAPVREALLKSAAALEAAIGLSRRRAGNRPARPS